MKTQHPTLTLSVTATAELARLRFVGFDGNVADAAAKALGVAEAAASAGEQVPVNATGVLLVEAGGAIAAEAEVEVGAAGKAVAKAAGIGNGFALDAAVAEGDIIRILRGI